jgi:transposase InsO family protein
MTKFVSANVIRNKEAVTVAQAFEEEILDRHSCPFEIITDEGIEFNQEFAERLQKAGAKHIRIKPRNPKANGQVERMMKIIKSTLRIMCRKNSRKWEDKVARVVSEHNATYHRITKTSPFMLLFGRRPDLPANHLFPSELSAAIWQPVDDSLEANQRRVRNLHYLQERTIDVIEQFQRKERENYAKWKLKRRPRTRVLNEGDQVALLKSGSTRGFDLHWKGPYEFVKWLDPPENRQAQVKIAQGRILKQQAEEIVKFRQESEFLHEVIEPLNPTVQVQGDDPLAVKQDLEGKTREVAPEFLLERHSEYLRLDKRTRRARNLAKHREFEQITVFWKTGVWTELDDQPCVYSKPFFL